MGKRTHKQWIYGYGYFVRFNSGCRKGQFARYADQLDESFAAMNLNLSDEVMGKIQKIQSEIMYPMG